MPLAALEGFEKPRLKALLEHFASIEDPREPWRVAHPLPESCFWLSAHDLRLRRL